MKPFVINRHGQVVLPYNFFPEMDLTVFETLEQFTSVIKREFEQKARTEDDILSRLASGEYRSRYELLRDLALHMDWVNRYAFTLYEKRPMRWRDVPKHRDDVFLQVIETAGRIDLTAAVEAAYWALPPTWPDQTDAENECLRLLLNVVGCKASSEADVPALPPTLREVRANPRNLAYCLRDYDPEYPVFAYDDVLDCRSVIPELEALTRQAMVLHNQYPWDAKSSARRVVEHLHDQDVVVVLYPRSTDALQFIRRAKSGRPVARPVPVAAEARKPMKPYPPVEVRRRFSVLPRLESLAVYEGEVACTNEDLIRNFAYNWSCMTAKEIREKTGIEQRLYTHLDLEEISLRAAQAALAHAGRKPEEIGAVLFCTCTSSRLIPSTATWLSGQLGCYQTHVSCDIVAACAGFAYGLSEAIRLMQEVERPVLVVCAEKFSDKIGTVRTSRMIFGDGAAAVVVGPSPAGGPCDVDLLQTYASGPWAEVSAIIWPNPDFDNNITVYGPHVQTLVKRYLAQMIGELTALPHPDGQPGTFMDAIDLVIPHQANQTMVTSLAQEAGVAPERLYFNIARVGNTSAASIPMAIRDAVREGRIDRPMRIFAPGFGAGAVAGYTVLRVDPAIVA
jgi:3-oxoacyl-[acyl-carrier-protein] synthase III